MTLIPNGIFLEILAYVTFKSLIIARGVNHQWRQFVDLADLHPVRRALLELYLPVVCAPWFLRSHPWLLAKLRPFDREAYNHNSDDFALWILEWPARTTFQGIWPGFPGTEVGTGFSLITKARGINSIGAQPPTVYTITHGDWDGQRADWRGPLTRYNPSLAIQRERYAETTWLPLGKSKEFHGMALSTETHGFFQQDDNPMSVGYNLEQRC